MVSRSGVARRAGDRPRRGLRRALLATLALGAIGAPPMASGCVGGFDPPSRLNGLRVLGATIDKPYANPGDEVTLRMVYADGYGDPEEAERPVTISWIGGCFNPIGDEYYACFAQIAEQLADLGSGAPPPPGVFGFGEEFKVNIPTNIVSSRPEPVEGPWYGIAYVFFAVCAGQLGPVEPSGSGGAGDFPFGCFDAQGRRLGADSFVPGYTQIYVFSDGRTNANPEVQGLTLDGELLPEQASEIPTVAPCPVSAEERRASGCSAEDPFSTCKAYEIEAVVDPNVAEPDPDAKEKPLTEVVWVNYFADQGDLSGGIKLVNDASTGYNEEHQVQWIPPAEPGIARLWAVVRDARGGSSVVERLIRVE